MNLKTLFALASTVLFVAPFGSVNAIATSMSIKHIIILFEENRTFDHYFGTYQGANGFSEEIMLPLTPGSIGLVRPFHMPTTETPDLDHSSRAARTAYNNGKMDGFVYAEKSNLTLGYYDYRDIPYYWDYASRFVLMDNFFSSEMGPSLPNHLYLIAGQSGNLHDNTNNFTLNFKTIMDEFDSRNRSWKYYADALAYKQPGLWNPLPAFVSFKTNPARMKNLAPNDQFLTDLSNGNLSEVVFVMPKNEESEHPPNDVRVGEHYVVSLVNAVMQSKYWDSCAIFIAWDDYGGFYDHVPPPQIDAYGLGFRVPCLIISPFAKEGFIDHTQSEFASILRFIESVHSIPPLTQRDAKANDMMEAFDFTQAPRQPLILPGLYVPDHYPLTLAVNATTSTTTPIQNAPQISALYVVLLTGIIIAIGLVALGFSRRPSRVSSVDAGKIRQIQ